MNATQLPALVSGRSCEGCSLCCRVTSIEDLAKPAGVWCECCVPGREGGGCTIYDERPPPCRSFYCGYMLVEHIQPNWRPLDSGLVLRLEGKAISVLVDPDRPDAWRKEPFHREIVDWARMGASARNPMDVGVFLGEKLLFSNLPPDCEPPDCESLRAVVGTPPV